MGLAGTGLLFLGTIATAISALAHKQGPCAQIRFACQDAGFIPGAALEGIGLQVHCIIPIIQARTQPPSARRPLPKINPLLVADCRASNPAFAQQRAPQVDAPARPASPPSPRFAQTNGNPPPLYKDGGTNLPMPATSGEHWFLSNRRRGSTKSRRIATPVIASITSR
jgi:hypothetical protein